jgi:hypothetical protein
MNRLTTLLPLLLFFYVTNAQPVVKPDTDPANKGGTITETNSTEGEWTKKVTEKKDKDQKPLEHVTVEETPDKRRKVRTIIFDKKGDTLLVLYTIFDREGEATYHEKREYNGGKLTHDEKAWLNPGNKKYKWHILNPNGTYGDYGEKEPHKNWDQSQAEPEKQASACMPQHSVAIGYNYLNVATGADERLSVPFGARVEYEYHFNPKWSVALDVTYNKIKDEDIREMWWFLLFGPSYKWIRATRNGAMITNGPHGISPWLTVKVGAVQHRYKYIDPMFSNFNSSDFNFCAKLGGGVSVKTGIKTQVNFRADYIPVWYKNGDKTKMESNYSLGVDIDLLLGCKRY